MAADKKKASGGKNSSKASSKSSRKSKKISINADAGKSVPCPPIDPENIVVPKGGQVIQFYELSPAFPKKVKGKLQAQPWKLVPRGCKKPLIENISVGFHENASKLERVYERAILVINIQQTEKTGTWRFALGGIATDLADSDPDNDIKVELIDNGLTMLVFVHVIPEASRAEIGFRFVASFTHSDSGVVDIYASPDPGFIPVRPVA